MDTNSRNANDTRFTRTAIYLVAGLGLLLAGTMLVAGDASAQTVDSIDVYEWSDGGSNAEDGVDHQWTNLTGSSGEIPSTGLHLVRVSWTDTGARDVNQIRVVYDEDSSTTEVVRTWDIDDDEGTEGQEVHLANTTGGPQLASESGRNAVPDSGCASTDTRGLSDDRPNCWFLVEMTPNGGPSPLSTNTDYNVRVELVDSGGSKLSQSTYGSTVTPIADQTSVTDVSFEDSDSFAIGSTTAVEAGRQTTVNVTISMGDPSGTNRNSPDWNTGDVDVWLCLYRNDLTNPDPYKTFPELTDTSPSAWDDGPDCEFTDYPTHDGLEPTENGVAVPLTQVRDPANPQVTGGDGGANPDTRFYDASFDFSDVNDELETEGGSFVDDFYMRVVMRDSWSNVAIHDLDGQSDSISGNASTPFAVGSFDVSQSLETFDDGATIDSLTSQDFRDSVGCFQPNATDTSPNSVVDPCLRAIDYAPADQSFAFPVTLLNKGNLQDTVNVDFEHESGEGQQSWTFELENANGDFVTPPVAITIPGASPGSAETREIQARITPTSDAIAEDPEPTDAPTGGFSTAGLWSWSENTRDDQAESDAENDREFLQAHLLTRDLAEIGLGEDNQNTIKRTIGVDDTDAVQFNISNDGNTDGPFKPVLDTDAPGHDGTTCKLNKDNPDADEIDIQLAYSGSDPDDRTTILPGNFKEDRLDIEVGESVSAGTYDCVFTLKNTATGDEVALSPQTPTLTIKVEGDSQIELLETRGADRDEFNVTGKTVRDSVPPDDGSHDVFIYMENTGNIGLEPELIDDASVFQIRNALELGGTWKGVNDSASSELSLASASQPFSLPISDEDDPDVEVRDLFDANGNPLVSNTDQAGPWTCASLDGNTDTDNDARSVCQLHFRYDFTGESAVRQDLVVNRFRFADTSQQDGPVSETEVRLNFGFPGDVIPRTNTQKAIGSSDTTDLVFDAELDSNRQFDPDANDITAGVHAKFTGSAGCEATDTAENLVSSSKGLRSATFRTTVERASEKDACRVAVLSDGGIEVTTGSGTSGTLAVELIVTDENGTRLQQASPVHVKLVDASSVTEPSEVAQEELFPSDELAANGTQFARLFFEPSDTGFPASTEDEGLVFTRRADSNGLVPFSQLDLNSAAVSATGDSQFSRQWTSVQPNTPAAGEPDYNKDDRVGADQSVDGLVLTERQQDGDNVPVEVGNVELFGWGDGTDIAWTEGWNPLVLQVTDTNGRPLEGDTSANSLELELNFAVRNATQNNEEGELTDSYQLSTQQDTILLRSLGKGYFAVDIFVPDGIDENQISGSQVLADHPTEGQAQDVDMEAWTMHLEVQNAQSTAGSEVDGDAYWGLDTLGMVTSPTPAPNATQNGTLGASAIAEGQNADDQETFASLRLDDDQTVDDDNREFLHVSSMFLGGPVAPTDDWTTGPGVHDYRAFAMREDDNRQENTQLDDQETSSQFREHTFSPATSVDLTMQLEAQSRQNAPGEQTTPIPSTETSGLYNLTFGLPQLGVEEFDWVVQLDATVDSRRVELVRPLTSIEDREAASFGLPMPLSFDDADVFTTESGLGDRQVFDLRRVPGMTPDRGDFGFAPLVENSAGGIAFQIDDLGRASFTVEGEGLVNLDPSQLPTQAEENIPVSLSLEPSGPVETITAKLKQDGETLQTVELHDDDRDGIWTGSLDGISLDSNEEETFRLTVKATDTAGGETIISTDLAVSPDQPPRINIIQPSEQDGTRVMQSNESIRIGVTDASLGGAGPTEAAEFINVSASSGGGTDTSGSALVGTRINVTGIDSKVTPGTKSITVTVENDTGEPSIGEVNVTVDGTEAFNTTLDANGEATGDVTFADSDAGSTVTLGVEYNDTRDANDTTQSFSVDVVDTSSGFSVVPESELEYSCGNATCEVTYTPSGLSDGANHTFRVVAEDAAGNENSLQASVEIDDTAPDATITVGDGEGSEPISVGPDTTVEVEATDDFGIASARLIGGSASVSFPSGSGTAQISELGLSGATSTIAFRAEDRAGNVANVTKQVELDTQSPSIGPVTVQTAGESQLRVSLSTSDDVGVTNVRLSTRGSDSVSFDTTPMSLQAGTWQATVDCPSGDTLRYFVQAEDAAGNQAEKGARNNPQAAPVPSDACTSEPEDGVSITSPADNDEVSGNITIELSARPSIGSGSEIQRFVVTDSQGKTVSLDTSGTSASLDTTQLADGDATIEVQIAVDGDRFTDTVTVTINNKVPVDHEQVGNEIRICASAESVPANVTTATIRIESNGELVSELDATRSEGQFCGTTELSEGTYSGSLTYTSEDGTETTNEIEVFTVGAVPGGDKPVAVFSTLLVLGLAAIGASSFAAFQRWS